MKIDWLEMDEHERAHLILELHGDALAQAVLSFPKDDRVIPEEAVIVARRYVEFLETGE